MSKFIPVSGNVLLLVTGATEIVGPGEMLNINIILCFSSQLKVKDLKFKINWSLLRFVRRL
jgi:hypothetical protein